LCNGWKETVSGDIRDRLIFRGVLVEKDATNAKTLRRAINKAVLYPDEVWRFILSETVTRDATAGMLEAVVRLCSTPLAGAALVDVSITIAAAIYADPSHENLSTLTVSSWTPNASTGYLDQVDAARNDDYQAYLWDNTSGALRAAWK
jgi:hypothetical protein